ncbi:hypothetical protein DITRI_Ditri12bG0163600 [Diplodiscus trichospermus]
MDILVSLEVDDLSNIKHAIFRSCSDAYDNESEGEDTSDVEELVEQGHRSKPLQKFLGECSSFPSAVSSLEEDVDEIKIALRRIFSEDTVQSPCSRSVSLPTPLKLVSALKGGREKQGLSHKKLTVTWAPNVYDPAPTSVLHTVRGKKRQKSKKNNDKKKNGKKGQKGNNSSHGSGGDKKKQTVPQKLWDFR